MLWILVWMTAQAAAVPATSTQPGEPPDQPRAVAVDAERLDELLSLVVGPNPPKARRTGVRELLLLGWPEVENQLVGILQNHNAPAKAAVASVLAERPAALTAAYRGPLEGLLAETDPDVRRAAVNALAAYPDDLGLIALRERLAAPATDTGLRQHIVQQLGLAGRRAAVEILVAALDTADDATRDAILRALADTAGRPFDSAEAARRWWDEVGRLNARQWREQQTQWLTAQRRRLRADNDALETRLVRALQRNYELLEPSERAAEVLGLLNEPMELTQLVGLELVQNQLGQPWRTQPRVVQAVQGLLVSARPAVRAAAVRALVGYQDPNDAARLRAMFAQERSDDVLIAIASGLGFLGDSESVAPLVERLAVADASLQSAILTSVGRLAERGLIRPEQQDEVVAKLLALYDPVGRDPERASVRERVLSALGRVAPSRSVPQFVEALDPSEPAPVRYAALRGLAAAPDLAPHADLLPLASDPDVQVRREVAALLPRLSRGAQNEALRQALATLADPARETDESVRAMALSGVTTLAAELPVEQLAAWREQMQRDQPRSTALQRSLLRLELERLRGPEEAARRVRLGIELGRVHVQLEEFGSAAEALAEAFRAVAPGEDPPEGLLQAATQLLEAHAGALGDAEAVLRERLRAASDVSNEEGSAAALLTESDGNQAAPATNPSR